jgi:3-hydroxy-9,10-secoandrosta-1,3,5(10)-triene-9,17-dione monooxygenase reductase component
MIPRETDTRAFRDALGMFGTGVTVVTTCAPDGSFTGLTVSSFNAVSLDPPLIVWSLSLNSTNIVAFRACRHYVVNVLAQDQAWLSQRFAQSNSDKFYGIEFGLGVGGAPLLAGCCAWFECRNEAHHGGGDHLVFIGLVERFARDDRPPLIFHGGRYRALKDLPE